MRDDNIRILEDTLKTCESGEYIYDGKAVNLKLTYEQMLAASVYLPDQLDEMRNLKPGLDKLDGECSFSCVNADSYALARQIAADYPEDKVLVLNLANPVHIGGGVRRGAKAQEEDLCRQSTLLLSIESGNAAGYYRYNRSLHTRRGSDAIIITPDVEVFKDSDYNYLEHSTVVSVMTCAAPILDPVTKTDDNRYRKMMYHRIEGMLVCAAYCGYRRLVLGAFGCGAFNNDARIVSDIFYQVISEFRFDNKDTDELFRSIDFAVLSTKGKSYNFDEFFRNFGECRSLRTKRQKMREEHPEFIGFWHEYDEYGCFSNWYKADFEYAGKNYSSVEQFMMYHKLMTFRQYELADKVMATDDPAEAKKIGRTKFKNFDDKLWTRISTPIVKRGVRAKFEQNPELSKILLSTGNVVLAECSPYDQVWGIGLSPNDERIYDTSQWQGKNKLGRILMIVREELRQELRSGLPECNNVRNAELIPEFEINAGMLKMIPQYHDAIDAYTATLDSHQQQAFYEFSLKQWDIAMCTNMGGGLPIIGFYEMMQDVYDISRRINVADINAQRVVPEGIKEITKLDRIRGCLIGGAAGDALGYAVEFLDIDAIKRQFGENGITEYSIDGLANKAVVSDDTQMTLFTAVGLLYGETRGAMRGIMAAPYHYVHTAYDNWYRTQTEQYIKLADGLPPHKPIRMWLMDVPELFKRRAPGNTCLSALATNKERDIEHPINNSKGCGGVMRVAPIGLTYPWYDLQKTIREAAEEAAVTHGHPLGFIPAGILAGIIKRIMINEGREPLKTIINDAVTETRKEFGNYSEFDYLEQLISKAFALAWNDEPDLENIGVLGEGWVAEETLAIAIYCALRYQDDFSKGIIAAVNHSGDSDSTGAVTGNILGAWLGIDAIESKWTDDLEMLDVITEVADDLDHGCQINEYTADDDPVWLWKYVYGRRNIG